MEEFKSSAQILFEGKEVINERPEEMPFVVYKALRMHQGKLLSKLFPGPVVPRIQQGMGLKLHYNLHNGRLI
jgi:hypothetical protein